MRTYIDCVPCFFRQAVEASRVVKATPEMQKRIIDAVAQAVTEYPMNTEPPRMAISLHRALREVSGIDDPYFDLKRRSNERVRKALPGIVRRIEAAQDRMRLAAELAVAGNIIDFGAQVGLDLDTEIERIVRLERTEELSGGSFQYEKFGERLEQVGKGRILWIGDNAGEMFFDRLLIQEILARYPEVRITYAVRGGPIINDGTYEDAVAAGINTFVPVMDTGIRAPGALLDLCSEEFLTAFHAADMVISKGQGNYEALSACGRSVFFLFMVKCDIVAEHTGLPKGSILLAEGDGNDYFP